MDDQHHFSVGEMVKFKVPKIFWDRQIMEGRIDGFIGKKYVVIRPNEVPGKTIILELDDILKMNQAGGRRTKRKSQRKSQRKSLRKSRRRYAK